MQIKTETRVGAFVLAAIGIFMYMGFQIGVFRFDRMNYNSYKVYFADISGLSKKAEVKVSGVKVGWVEDLGLTPQGEAEAVLMVSKQFALYQDSYALVRQDGLLGAKYIELVVGDPLLAKVEPGKTLGKPGTPPSSVDEIIQTFGRIATNVEEVTGSLKGAVGGNVGRAQLQTTFENLNYTFEKMASISDILERTLRHNEENLNDTLEGFKEVAHELRDRLPQLGETLQCSVEKISEVFDRDFGRAANRVEATTEAFEEASLEVRDTFKSVGSVANKIDEGKGMLGKLVNDEETYRDIKEAAHGLKNYFHKIETLQILLDMHGENMHRIAENFSEEDRKGYLDIRIHPRDDVFYLVQLVASFKGSVERYQEDKQFFDANGDQVFLPVTDSRDAASIQVQRFTRGTIKLGLQVGKMFNNIAFRVGMFENAAGVALDYDVPFNTDKFRWVTSVEVFDFIGWHRKDDTRPHLKWINRVFILDTIYMTFGADDFISKDNANAFFGVGMRFDDDDFKYIFSRFGGALT